jgi:integrase
LAGRGHVRQRGGGWVVVLDLGRDPFTNRRRQRWVSGFSSHEEAEAALPSLLRDSVQAPAPASPPLSLHRFIEMWLSSLLGRGLRPTTIACYRTALEAHVLPRLGRVPLARLSALHLNDLYARLLVDGRVDGRGGLSPRSVRLVHSIVRKALADAVRWGNVGENVALRADPPRVQQTLAMRTWSAAQLREFLASVGQHPLRVCFWVLATTGMRRGEALGLRWCDVDLERGRLSIVQTLVQVPGGVHFSQPKTARSRRVIALDETTVQVLREHQELHSAQGLGGELVFARADGSPLLPHSVSKAFRAATVAAGLPRVRLHDLRHTHASLGLQAGLHPKVISERLGHSTVAITLDTYSHVVPALDEQAAETIASLLRRPGLDRNPLSMSARRRASVGMRVAA